MSIYFYGRLVAIQSIFRRIEVLVAPAIESPVSSVKISPGGSEAIFAVIENSQIELDPVSTLLRLAAVEINILARIRHARRLGILEKFHPIHMAIGATLVLTQRALTIRVKMIHPDQTRS